MLVLVKLQTAQSAMLLVGVRVWRLNRQHFRGSSAPTLSPAE